MSPLIVAAALSILALDSAPATAPTATVALAAAAGSGPASPASEDKSRICRATEITGSRFQRRICMSRTEWVEYDRRQQQELDDWVRRTNEHAGYAPTIGTTIGANGATGGQVR